MSDRRYQVRFTGKLKPGMSQATVKSNLLLETGLPEEKVDRLFARGESLIKRFDTLKEAQRLAAKFERAGVLCKVVDAGEESGGKSLFSSFLKVLSPERG